MTKNDLTIQEKLANLRELIAWFDGDEFTLENAADMFKKAENLAREIEEDLATFKNDIQVVKQSFDTKV